MGSGPRLRSAIDLARPGAAARGRLFVLHLMADGAKCASLANGGEAGRRRDVRQQHRRSRFPRAPRASFLPFHRAHSAATKSIASRSSPFRWAIDSAPLCSRDPRTDKRACCMYGGRCARAVFQPQQISPALLLRRRTCERMSTSTPRTPGGAYSRLVEGARCNGHQALAREGAGAADGL